MIYPNVTFHKSVKKDIATLRAFIKDAPYDNGRNLDWSIFKKYPELKTEFDKNSHYKIRNEKRVSNFINEKYQNKQDMMDQAMKQYANRWEKMAPKYFSLVDELFSGRKWPKGKYIAYGTIWGMYPRFLEDKTFQVPFKHRKPRYVMVVVAHELLHFMFYDYFYARYPKYRRPKHNYFVWHVSEIFNTIVQNSPQWLHCFKLKSLGYPEHKKIIMDISRTLYRLSSWDLNALVDKIIEEVKKKIKNIPN